jgi:sugar phosphate permease
MRVLADPYRRRWLGWGLLAAAFFLVSFHRLTTAVLSGELTRAFETTGTRLGVLHSSFFVLYALFQIPAGVLADQWGTRSTAAAGTAVMSLGAVVSGTAPTYAAAVGGRLLVGFGASVLFVATLRFCANWFEPDEFGTMTGVTFTVGILGGLTASTPLAVAVVAVGWRTAMVGLGGLGFVVAAGIALVSHNSPATAGLPPIESVPATPTQTWADLRRHTVTAACEPETWLVGVVLFLLIGVSVTVFGLWGVPFLVQLYDLSVTEASVYVLVGSAGGLVGPTLFGWISDRLGRRTGLIALSTLGFGAAWGAFAALGTPPLPLVAGLLFLSRAVRGGLPLAYTVIKERHPGGASGTVIGMVNTFGWLGAVVFPVVLGAVLDAFWTGGTLDGTRLYTATGYRVAFAIAAGAGLLATACAVWLHRRHATGGPTPADRAAADDTA